MYFYLFLFHNYFFFKLKITGGWQPYLEVNTVEDEGSADLEQAQRYREQGQVVPGPGQGHQLHMAVLLLL